MTKVLNHLDFGKKSQVLHITIHKVSALPNPGWAGGLVYLEGDGLIYWHNGTDWIAINSTAGLITSVTGGAGITVTESGGVAKVTLDPDDTTIGLIGTGDAAKAYVKDNAITTIKVLDRNITFNKIQNIPTMTVIGRVASGTQVSSAIAILDSLDNIIAAHDSLVSAKAAKAYVDSVVGGLGSFVGGWNAATQSVFPTPANKGDYWYVTAAGSIQGVNFDAGDVMIAKDNASATDPLTWVFLEVNREQATLTTLGVVMLATQDEARGMTDPVKALTPKNLGDVKATDAQTQTGTEENRFITPANLSSRTASESRTGIAELATQAEVNAGSDDSRIVTPAKLKVYAENLVSVFGRHTTLIGNGSATNIAVTHTLDTRIVKVEVWDAATFETVIVDVVRTSNTQVNFSFADAPALNAYRVFIMK